MISYLEDDKKFNFRVGAIIQNHDKNKILIHRLSNFDFWLLPGGRAEILENTADGIQRELKEELGIIIKPKRLAVVSENFFKLKNQLYHELGFNYLFQIDDTCRLNYIQGEFCRCGGREIHI